MSLLFVGKEYQYKSSDLEIKIVAYGVEQKMIVL